MATTGAVDIQKTDRYLVFMATITWYRNLYSTKGITHAHTWDSLCNALSSHMRSHEKTLVPLFGPYSTGSGADRAQRADANVEAVTVAVFDADTGSAADVTACRAALALADVSSFWYTTHSHRAPAPGERESWRLLIELRRPISPASWKAVRSGLINKFSIPCDIAKCSGASHAYYFPSCPPNGQPETFRQPGRPCDTSEFEYGHPVLKFNAPAVGEDEVFAGGGDKLAKVGIKRIREKLRRRAERYRKEGHADKAELLDRCLAGEPLATAARDVPTSRLCAILVTALHPLPLETYLDLVNDSVSRMIRDGSSLRWFKVEQMFRSIARKRVQEKRDEEATRQHWKEEMQNIFTKVESPQNA